MAAASSAASLSKKPQTTPTKQTRFVCVHPGIAIDCHGDPLELCRPVKLDLDPDPCKCPPDRVCIVIRRRDGKSDGGDACGCGPSPEDSSRRVREEVEIRVVDYPASSDIGDLCWNLQATPRDDSAQGKKRAGPVPESPPEHDRCACLKACEPCDDCKEGWILLACIRLESPKDDDKAPAPDRDRWSITDIDEDGRKYIKPIHCQCPPKTPRHLDDEPGDSYEKPETKSKTRSRPKTRARPKAAV